MTTQITTILDEVKKQAEAATPAPWFVAKEGMGNKGKFPTVYATTQDLNYVCQCADGLNTGSTLNLENAAFIASSRTTVPTLADALRIAVDALHVGARNHEHIYKTKSSGYHTTLERITETLKHIKP